MTPRPHVTPREFENYRQAVLQWFADNDVQAHVVAVWSYLWVRGRWDRPHVVMTEARIAGDLFSREHIRSDLVTDALSVLEGAGILRVDRQNSWSEFRLVPNVQRD